LSFFQILHKGIKGLGHLKGGERIEREGEQRRGGEEKRKGKGESNRDSSIEYVIK